MVYRKKAVRSKIPNLGTRDSSTSFTSEQHHIIVMHYSFLIFKIMLKPIPRYVVCDINFTVFAYFFFFC